MVAPKQTTAVSSLNIAGLSQDSIVLRQVKLPGLKRSLTTPQVYQLATYTVWGSALFVAATVTSAVMAQREAIRTVGFDTTPSIYHAQRIRDSIADMDANAANVLLVKPGENPTAEKDYQKRKEKLSNLVIQASKNITDLQEQKLIANIILNVNQYVEYIQQAKDFQVQNKPEESLRAYREAQKLVDEVLMPDADNLDKTNFRILEKAYAEDNTGALGQRLLVLMSGAMLLGSLVGIQLLMSRWTQRRINPMVFGATVLSGFFLLDTLVSLSTASTQLKIAKDDAFTSLYALRQARSLAYSLNADESRYLLDRSSAAQHETAFNTKIKQLATISSTDVTRDPSGFQAQLQQMGKTGKPVSGFSGLFATQLSNITFPGELKATQTMMADFATYFSIDAQIRAFQTAGKRAEAIELCTGTKPGQSNRAFAAFMDSHSKVMDVNIEAFNQAIKKGLLSLDAPNPGQAIGGGESVIIQPNTGFDMFWGKLLVITGSIGALTYSGLLQRIKEYEA
jgi:hypothetical protein